MNAVRNNGQAHSSKSKRGCRTCKLRKVKCDEYFPQCHRCLKADRHCGGYGIWGGGVGISIGSTAASENIIPHSESESAPGVLSVEPCKPHSSLSLLRNDEKASFEWYVHRSAIKLPGVFNSQSWTMSLIQATMTEPAVLHALLALASAHQEEVAGASSTLVECITKQSMFTVRQYNKAITSLQPATAFPSKESTRVALMTCILFNDLEMLSGHYARALIHLEHGLHLLRSFTKHYSSLDPASAQLDGWLVTVFMRQLVQVKLFGQLTDVTSPACFQACLEPETEIFRSRHHARRTLDHITLKILDIEEFCRQSSPSIDLGKLTKLRSDQTELQGSLQRWHDILEATVLANSANASVLEKFIWQMLRLHYRMVLIMAGTCVDVWNETRYDSYIPVFLNILLQCINIYKFRFENGRHARKGHHDPESTSPNSITDIGWIGPLYFTAMKCRNHRIRHHALKLLRTQYHKEGIWSAYLCDVIASKVIQIEEGDLEYKGQPLDFDKLDEPKDSDLVTRMPPLQSRLTDVKIMLPQDRGGILLLSGRRRSSTSPDSHIALEYSLSTQRWTNCDSMKLLISDNS